MGMSRNKVAVSEGAAGSPPFYGEVAGKTVKFLGQTTEESVGGELVTTVQRSEPDTLFNFEDP